MIICEKTPCCLFLRNQGDEGFTTRDSMFQLLTAARTVVVLLMGSRVHLCSSLDVKLV
jgi:hypothetical protein